MGNDDEEVFAGYSRSGRIEHGGGIRLGRRSGRATGLYKAPPTVAAVYDWSGFYIGGHIGGGWADENSIELAPGTTPFPIGTAFAGHDLSGFLGGVQGGFNWQANNFVLGVEGDLVVRPERDREFG